MSLALVIMMAAFVVLVPTSLVLLSFLREEDRLTMRLQAAARVQDPQQDVLTETRSGIGLLRPVAVIGGVLARSGLLSTKTLADLQQTLNSAGLRGQAGLSVFVGAKLLLLLGLPTLTLFLMTQLDWWPSYWNAVLAGSAILGLLLPDIIIKQNRKTYIKNLDKGMADALDMLVICTEAGLGLESSFERVSMEIALGHPVVAKEMTLTVQEMQINSDRRAALLSMGERTGLVTLKRLGGTLVQTMQYGTPLSNALRTLSVEMRAETLMRFEEKAARLPVLLTLPMVLFILPCIFLVVGAPAIIQVIAAFT